MFNGERDLMASDFTHIEISKRYSVTQHVNDLGQQFSSTLRTMSFSDANCGWASGGGGQLLRTIDGGLSWKSVRLPSPGQPYLGLEGVHPLGCDSSWLFANLSGDADLFFSEDGGATWLPRGVRSGLHCRIVGSTFFFLDRSHGWIVCGRPKGRRIAGSVALTLDGGESWQQVPLPTKDDPFKVVFVDRNTGWIAERQLATTNGKGATTVHRTIDGGRTWAQVSQVDGEVTNFVATSDESLFIAGWGGLLLRSRDGARTWERLYTATRLIIADLHIRGPIGLAVGSSEMLRSRRSSLLLLSTDGGTNWCKLESPIRDTFFAAYLTGWDRGVLASPYALYRFRLRNGRIVG